MRCGLERRIAQAEIAAAAKSPLDQKAAKHRQSLRTTVDLCESIRRRFQQMGICLALIAFPA